MEKLKDKRWQIILLLATTLLAYSNIFTNNFVWDDRFFILEWQKLKSLGSSLELLGGELPEGFQGAFRPILGFFYLIFYQLFGENALGWHIQSVIVHLINTLLVYLIIKKLVESTPRYQLIPFICALIFGVHPIHTEAVTYISASINTIGYVFMLGSFYLYIVLKDKNHKLKISYYILSIVLSLLAFFTYEFTLTLPLLILIYSLIFKIRSKKYILAYFLTAGCYLIFRLLSIHTIGRGEYLGDLSLTMLTMTKVFLKYLYLLILPLGQTINHTLPGGILSAIYIDVKKEAILAQSIFNLHVILSLAILILSLILAFKLIKKEPLISFAIFFFYISLLPASNIIPVQELMAERYLYLPSVGFILLLMTIFKLITDKLKFKFLPCYWLVIPLLLSLTYVYLTYQRNKVWVSDLTLWQDTVLKSPGSSLGHYNFGKSYADAGKTEEAIKEYLQAIEQNPNFAKPYNNLGAIFTRINQFDQAEKFYQQALLINPNFYQVYYNLATTYMKQKRIEEAVSAYLKAVEINPDYVKAYGNLGVAYFELGEKELAKKQFEKALQLNPNYLPAKINLQKLYEEVDIKAE